MKRFLIHVSTYWCGMDDTFRAVAESEMELWDLAEQLAYDNFQSYSCENDIAEEEGYDPDEMEESDWDELWSRVDESTYYSFSIEECEDDEEWKGWGGEIYFKRFGEIMIDCVNKRKARQLIITKCVPEYFNDRLFNGIFGGMF